MKTLDIDKTKNTLFLFSSMGHPKINLLSLTGKQYHIVPVAPHPFLTFEFSYLSSRVIDKGFGTYCALFLVPFSS